MFSEKKAFREIVAILTERYHQESLVLIKLYLNFFQIFLTKSYSHTIQLEKGLRKKNSGFTKKFKLMAIEFINTNAVFNHSMLAL